MIEIKVKSESFEFRQNNKNPQQIDIFSKRNGLQRGPSSMHEAASVSDSSSCEDYENSPEGRDNTGSGVSFSGHVIISCKDPLPQINIFPINIKPVQDTDQYNVMLFKPTEIELYDCKNLLCLNFESSSGRTKGLSIPANTRIAKIEMGKNIDFRIVE